MKTHLCILSITLSLMSQVVSWSDLMTCSNWPNMATPTNTGLGRMGTAAKSYSTTNHITVNGASVAGNTATYVPGSTITISMSPFSGQLVFEASNGAVFQGAAGRRNVNGIISGCSSTSRYQMYSATSASLTMPSSGTVTIQCNFASSSGSGRTFITIPITLTAASASVPTPVPVQTIVKSSISPSARTVVTTPVPLNKPTISPVRTSVITPVPVKKPTTSPSVRTPVAYSPTAVPVKKPTIVPLARKNPTKTPTYVPSESTAWPTDQPTEAVENLPPTTAGGAVPTSSTQALSSTNSNGSQSVIFIVAFLMSVACVIAFVIFTLMYRKYKKSMKQAELEEDADAKADFCIDEENMQEDSQSDDDSFEEDDQNPEIAVESTTFISKSSFNTARSNNGTPARNLGADKAADDALTRRLSVDVPANEILANPMIYNKSKGIIEGKTKSSPTSHSSPTNITISSGVSRTPPPPANRLPPPPAKDPQSFFWW